MHLNAFLIFIFYNILSKTRAESCETPNDESAECVSLHSCSVLLDAINKNITSLNFIRQSLCGFNGADAMVCCGSLTNFKNRKPTMKKGLLPDRRYCGYQHSDDFLHKVNSTLITEFPWLARIAFKRDSDNETNYTKEYLCLGSIISKRYVLTSADCANPPGFTPIEAQLGDYHIGNETDCVLETGIVECSEPVRSYKIEKVIIYPNYNPERITNNIALFRLNKTLFFDDYIRPICLPFPGTKFAEVGDILTTSGWGFINTALGPAVVKKKVLTEMISNEDCKKQYKHQTQIIVDEKNVCIIKLKNTTHSSCIGDSGSPVIFSHRLQWHQVGIVSAGIGGCGDTYPDVLTKVESYLEWIKENIEP
ncbi:hypothetical protein ILUMI_16745 [Ignelater luminosus]|uniref:CLIP domain-containing serine protease n=1 Tax=Ignelater luminosus TaxID=2038154 RepID=A0A8K0CRQ8_IGNLU|nr:hypothetical protein ILUMI_16745 [Ignelater luminosus]